MALNVLAVLQDPGTRERVLELLSECGHETSVRSIPESGFSVVSETALDLLILEYRGEARALELIQRVKDERPRCQVVIITDHESMALREVPPQLGVRNLLYKPVNLDVLRRLVMFSARNNSDATAEPADHASPGGSQSYSKLVGSSPVFRSAVTVADQAAKSPDTPVLVIGESGSGKKLVARGIHDQSARRNAPFIYVSCASIPAELLESELFGHETGAFPGTGGRKVGVLELANRGTVYLDGVGHVDLPLQAKLLRFMDTGRLRRAGGDTDIESDVRVIASSHRDLAREVATRRFRTDLYNRLSGVQVLIPPLRERGSDILELTRAFVGRLARTLGREALPISGDAERLLLDYDWPGNVHELYDAVERALMSRTSGELRPDDFGIDASPKHLFLVDSADDGFNVRLPEGGVALEAIERKVIETALDRCRGNVMEAARYLRIGRGALRYKISKHDLEHEREGARALRKAS